MSLKIIQLDFESVLPSSLINCPSLWEAPSLDCYSQESLGTSETLQPFWSEGLRLEGCSGLGSGASKLCTP